jgi:hypothetical protein
MIGENQKLLNDFYAAVFDWKIDPVKEEYSLVNAGSGIAGGNWGDAASSASYHVFC